MTDQSIEVFRTGDEKAYSRRVDSGGWVLSEGTRDCMMHSDDCPHILGDESHRLRTTRHWCRSYATLKAFADGLGKPWTKCQNPRCFG